MVIIRARRSRWLGHRFLVVVGAAVLGLGLVATPAQAQRVPAIPAATASASASAALSGYTTHYAVSEPLCAQPSDPSTFRCFAERRVNVPKGTPGAREYLVPNSIGPGPAGGFTPDDLAAFYDYDPTVNRSSQLVGIVDWFDDPDTLTDLNAFDHEYGLPKETATSFRKVNQNGQTAPLPKADQDSSGEIALDIETVRGVCHTCRILLVEANEPSDASVAAAENRAASMGATEISNSFGAPEVKLAPAILAAYNHPGIVITASTGDDGWFAWDHANAADGSSANAAEFPSTDPTVVSVGGTSIDYNNNATRADETVWNNNGAADAIGFAAKAGQGAGGGGCSKLYSAQVWQSSETGYAATGCAGKRLAADISADADPNTGFDILDSFDGGWQTVGGTSLASPITAALFALAGGAGGAKYPASSLYVNANNFPTRVFDVTEGGNGFCGAEDTSACGFDVQADIDSATHNPNALGGGIVDCSFPRDNTDPASPPTEVTECNAGPGYDGPSGLGAPNSDALFTSSAPTLALTRPASLRLNASGAFSATATEHLTGVHPTKYVWTWGDGTTRTDTSTAAMVLDHHTYTHAGAYTITMTAYDTTGQQAYKTESITVGEPAAVHYAGPSSLVVHHAGAFNVHGTTDPNTGAKITKVTWKWGDGHSTAESSTAASPTHKYSTIGTRTITIVILDSTGVTTTVTRKVKIKS